MSDMLQKRARAVRARALVLAWEYRQRRYAKGAWFRLRRALTGAAEAYVIPTEAAAQLISEGCSPEPVCQEFQPSRLIVFAPKERILRIPDRRKVSLVLSGDLLEAAALALVRF